MNGATSLALARRLADARYADTYFVGHGIDIGCGPDPLDGYSWPHCRVRQWDTGDGDATTLPGIAAETFDFVYSSHCLEHLAHPHAALVRWWDVLKPGGYLIVVVPDFGMYERGMWPSRLQPEGHKTYWTPEGLTLAVALACPEREWVSLLCLTDRYDPALPVGVDQTTAPYNAECGIEAIVRKPV